MVSPPAARAPAGGAITPPRPPVMTIAPAAPARADRLGGSPARRRLGRADTAMYGGWHASGRRR